MSIWGKRVDRWFDQHTPRNPLSGQDALGLALVVIVIVLIALVV